MNLNLLSTQQPVFTQTYNYKKRGFELDSEIHQGVNFLKQSKDDAQIFADYVASEIRQIKRPANVRKLKRLINQAILKISEIDDEEYTNL